MVQSNHSLQLATWAEKIQFSAMQNSLTRSNDPDFISFALGKPACEFFPTTEYEAALKKIIYTSDSYQYMAPLISLKQQIVDLMKLRGVTCDVSEIFLTSGAQQGISLVTRILLDADKKFLVEEYAYPGFMQAVSPCQAGLLTVKTNGSDGVDVNKVEYYFKQKDKPALLYLVPDGNNPQAVSITLENRKRLAELAEYYKVPIIEDDPYGFLSYEHQLPALKSLSREWVFYIGTFSKILAPSLRVGWIVAPKEFHNYLAVLKEASDINIATFTQRSVAALLSSYSLANHIKKLTDIYKDKRDTAIDSIKKYFPQNIHYVIPNSGFFIWIELSANIDADELLLYAIENYKIDFISGGSFLVAEKNLSNRFLRLSFSCCNLKAIDQGIERLGQAIKHFN